MKHTRCTYFNDSMNNLLFNFHNILETILIVYIDINQVNARHAFELVLNITKYNMLCV